MEPLSTFEHDGRVLRLFACRPESDGSPHVSQPAPPLAARYAPRASPHTGAPGAGRFVIERLEAGFRSDLLTLAARITGVGIAYVYTELLLRDPAGERYYGPVWREHVTPPRTRRTRGAIRPLWDDPVEVTVESRPESRVLADGNVSAFCFAEPGPYGTRERRLGGLYTPVGGDRPFRAVLTLDASGEIVDLMALKEQGRRVLSRSVVPRSGDRLALFVTVLTPPSGDGGWNTEAVLTDEVTFSALGPRVDAMPLLPGEYAAGLVVQDLDGRLTRDYVPVAVG